MSGKDPAPARPTRYLRDAPGMPMLNLRAMLEQAAQDTGRGRAAILADWFFGFFLPRRMLLEEYFSFRLHDPARHAAHGRRGFVGQAQNRRFNARFNARSGQRHILLNKRLYTAMLGGLGLGTTRTIAAVSRSNHGAGCVVLNDAGALSRWLAEEAEYPLFGKPARGGAGVGLISVDAVDRDKDSLRTIDGRRVPIAGLADEIVRKYRGRGYIFMPRLRPHPRLRRTSGETIGAVRIVTLCGAGKARVLYAIWKVPGLGAVSDHSWGETNNLALVCVKTGQVLRAVSGTGFGLREIEAHPQTGRPLRGLQLPDWRAAVRLAVAAAELTPNVRLIGWDIALTDDGPKILEANTNTNHLLYQRVSGRPFLDARMRTAYRAAHRGLLRRLRAPFVKHRALRRAYLAQLRQQMFRKEPSP